jgi:Ca2+-binding RTX toxin-like protein
MTTINDAYINALLADACYVDDLLPGMTGTALASQVSGRMTADVAAYIGANFTVVQQVGGLASSFDATVWRGNAGTPYADQIYVSMRGTQEAGDFVADGDLAQNGLAHQQLADMVNWWLRETTAPVTDGDTRGYAPQIIVTGSGDFALGAPAFGTGRLIGIGAVTSVDGHSLGGYLASAFVRLFGASWPLVSISTFNSAGFSRPATTKIEIGFNQIAALIGPTLGLGAFSSNQNNYFALNGINVTTNTWNPIGFQQCGMRIGLFQEDAAPQGINNHYMYKLTDLLALGNALFQLDSSLEFGRLSAIAMAGSNQMAASYEGVLDAVRRLLIGPNATPTPVGDSNGSSNAGPQPQSRIDYQANIKGLTDSSLFKSLAGKVTVQLATNSDLASQAKTDFSAFLSLQTLSPVFLKTDTTGQAILKQANEALAQQWEADQLLTPVQKSAGLSNFSDAYLMDRQAMLQGMIAINRTDASYATALPGKVLANYTYTDIATGQTISFKGTASNAYGQQPQKVIFGGDGNDPLDGSDAIAAGLGDRLYGGGGNDTIDGKSGDDYLEGDSGDDTLIGGAGNDRLLGGAGNDTYKFSGTFDRDTVTDADGTGVLKLDDNTLVGGKANGVANTWFAKLESGQIVFYQVIDSSRSSTTKQLLITKQGDSADSITINNFDLSQALSANGYLGIKLDPSPKLDLGSGIGANPWKDIDAQAPTDKTLNLTGSGMFTLYLNQAAKAGQTFVLKLAGLVQDGIKAVLGDEVVDADGATITLAEGQTQVSFALIRTGSSATPDTGQLSATYQDGDQTATSNTWNLTVPAAPTPTNVITGDTAASAPIVTDNIAGTEGADLIQGLTGSDLLLGLAGNDSLEGGLGNDILMGGLGADSLNGGDGDDMILGSSTGSFIGTPGSSTDPIVIAQGDHWLWTANGTDADGFRIGFLTGNVTRDEQAGDAANVIDGGAGNDVVFAGTGDDLVHGGDGADDIEGMGGADVLLGDAGNDRIYGDAQATYTTLIDYTAADQHGSDFIDGGDGNDILLGQGGDDAVYGGAGNDKIWGDDRDPLKTPNAVNGNDYLDGEDGDDTIVGGGKDDTLYGGAGNRRRQCGSASHRRRRRFCPDRRSGREMRFEGETR